MSASQAVNDQKMQMFEALEEAVQRMGSRTELARALGLTKQTVHAWRRVPAIHAIKVEDLTGVPADRLRPDVFRERGRANCR